MTETHWPSSDLPSPTNPPVPDPHPRPAKRPKKTRNLTSPVPKPDNPNPIPPPPPLVLPRPLSAPDELAAALTHLRLSDPHLSHVIDSHDPPSFHSFLPPFQTLTRSIINQQLAFKAANTAYSRFVSLCSPNSLESEVTPHAVLSLSLSSLREIGISSRKSNYLRDLAKKFATGVLTDELILKMDDKSVVSMLTMVEGIGAWSVHMFLIFSLHRPDVLPVGDGGVRRGVQMLYGLDEVPRPSQMEKLCEKWRPYRSVGSWYMWRLSEAKAVGVGNGGGGEQQHGLMLENVQVFSNSLEF